MSDIGEVFQQMSDAAAKDAPMTSREELLAEALEDCLREHAGFTIKGECERKARAALAIPDPAQAVANPVMWVCLVPNPLGELRIRAWTADRKRMESLRAEGLDMQALYTSPVPSTEPCACLRPGGDPLGNCEECSSTGLPAPAPHAEVRETFVINNPDGSISLDAYAGMSRDSLKERCGELCRALSEWQFVAVTSATDGANTIENVREPYRSKVAQIIEAYSDETDAPQQARGGK